ncbi:elongation factor G [Aestuariirhabdus litorea]|uniref:Elongation factor G n=1 Tax=Aestuariirhabdus litorea TaxID=2528527 RepID=A0A3P3VSZ9_9GAMM|nr:elongation factor G [Aestuariirhabdus litorea]RRJ84816.1 elongation factor G [Aestuariirhabdus litorea]RWW98041.1 elongation factor G [Endozoicomonadaceae bacterium GTF-13]
MAIYSTEQIRNVVLTGHSGAGKTSLTEQLLSHSGTLEVAGAVARGNTVSDFSPQEREFGHSLDPSLCHFQHQGHQIHLLDTPGLPDFSGRSISVLSAADTALLVINATTGVETMSETMMSAAKERNLCRAIIINKIDAPGVNFPALLQQVRAHFGDECMPLNLPTEGGAEVVDCFFTPQSGNTALGEVEAAHDALVDQVVEVDEQLMELYLEQGQSLSPEQLHTPFEKALREGHLIPICFVSAESGAGIEQLLSVLTDLMPSPLEGNPPLFLKGEGKEAKPVTVAPDPQLHTIAHVFKVQVDPYMGRVAMLRVHQGQLTPSSQLFIGDARKPFKVTHLYRIQGGKHSEINRAIPGDLCAIAKVEDIHFDAVLHDSHDEDHHHLQSVNFVSPMYGLAVTPVHRGDEQKLSEALHKLEAEDPSLRVEHRASLNETVILGQGELHLSTVIQRMLQQFNVAVQTSPPSIAYRETITQAAQGHCRHKKQSGGAGQFGEVYLRVEPLPQGSGFEFHSEVVGGAIPGQFIPAVEKGVREVISQGAIAGFPMQDIKVVVYDGKHHSVDSKEIAFVAAGRKAFLDAVEKAGGVILEPVVSLKIRVPEHCIGDVTGDIAAKHGMVMGSTNLPGHKAEISAQAPMRTLSDYPSRVKSMSGGEGSFSMHFSHYDRAESELQRSLVKAHQSRSNP